MEKRSGIYQIKNLVNGKLYIGQSIDLHKRKLGHFALLKNDKHANCHLQSSYNKYGKQNFIFEILLYCEHFQLTDHEQFFVDQYKKQGLLYNTRLKCVDSNRGFIFSDEARKNMSVAHKGKHPSEETKKNMSKAHSGKNNPMWGKKGKDSPNYGRKHTEEQRKNMSGENNPMYGKKGKGSLNYGRKHTKKSIEKMILNSPNVIEKEIVLQIIELLNKEVSARDIAKQLGISVGSVYKVKNGGYNKAYNLLEIQYNNGSRVITKAVVEDALKMMDSGMAQYKIADYLHICEGTVSKVKNGGYNEIYDL